MSTLLVDADVVAYQVAFSTEEPIRWGKEEDEYAIWTLHSDELDCVRKIKDYYNTLKQDTQCKEIISAFSDKDNFRKEIYPDYKLNRTKQRKPLTLSFCRDYISKNYNGYVRPRLEADDILGILATSKIIKGNKIICSIDKDLNQIAGLHYNPTLKEFYGITKKQADYNFYYQCLVGDSTDNYKGAPTYGEVKTKKTLTNKKNLWKVVKDCYREQGLTDDDALVQARLARILRSTDYDFKKKQPILWSGNGK
tara:strand:- start:13893 stop:14648 length:756 start_codon:yes stop_codon:yes gene_type:complete